MLGCKFFDLTEYKYLYLFGRKPLPAARAVYSMKRKENGEPKAAVVSRRNARPFLGEHQLI